VVRSLHCGQASFPSQLLFPLKQTGIALSSWTLLTHSSCAPTALLRDAVRRTGFLVLATVIAAPVSAQTVTVNASKKYQTFHHWDTGDYVGAAPDKQSLWVPGFPNYMSEAIEAGFGDLGLTRITLGVKSGAENPVDYYQQYKDGTITSAQWRCYRYSTVNDNASATTLNPSGFQWSELDERMDQVVIPVRQAALARGRPLPVLNLIYVAFVQQRTAAGCPAGLPYVHMTYPAYDPSEYAEFMLAAVKHLDSKYGVVPEFVEIILEPDYGTPFWTSGTAIGKALVAVNARLDAAGYTSIKFVAPSTTNTINASKYFDQMIAVPGAQALVSEFGYHRYTTSHQAVVDVGTRGANYGIQTSMNEWIGADERTLYQDLVYGRVSTWKQNTFVGPTTPDDGGKYFLVNGSNPSAPVLSLATRTKRLYHYMHFIRPGAVRIGATPVNELNHEPVAFINADGSYVVVVNVRAAGSFTVGGLPGGTYRIRYAAGGAYNQNLPDATIGIGQTLTVPSFGSTGVVTIYNSTSTNPCASGVTLNPASTSIGAAQANGSVSVSAGGGCAWSASSGASWISVTSGASGAGTGTVAYSVTANTGTTSRTGTLTIGGRSFTVTQAGASSSCTYSISPSSASVAAGASTGSVATTTSAGCSWAASCAANWITIASGGSGNGNGSVTYSVAPNTGSSARTGTMSIAGKTFTVTQAAGTSTCQPAVTPTTATVPATGGSTSFSVTAGPGCGWTASSSQSWATIAAGGSGTGSGTVVVQVAANTPGSSRSATLTIGGVAVALTQQAAAPSIPSAPTNLRLIR
jgi:hypothetical protein